MGERILANYHSQRVQPVIRPFAKCVTGSYMNMCRTQDADDKRTEQRPA